MIKKNIFIIVQWFFYACSLFLFSYFRSRMGEGGGGGFVGMKLSQLIFSFRIIPFGEGSYLFLWRFLLGDWKYHISNLMDLRYITIYILTLCCDFPHLRWCRLVPLSERPSFSIYLFVILQSSNCRQKKSILFTENNLKLNY